MITPTYPPPGSISSTPRLSQIEQGLLADAIILEVVATGLWRICDGRIPSDLDGRVLGFVETLDGRFEVMQLADRFVWTSFYTMSAAIDHVTRTHRDVSLARAGSALAWLP